MALERSRGAKTQSLSLRMDPKTKFILEFMARVKGQSITTLVERAIKEVAGNVGIGSQSDEFGNVIAQSTWSDFWDPSEGARTLKLIASPHYPTTFDEDELRLFVKKHWPFFYTDSGCDNILTTYLEILWPRMDKYLEIWRQKRTEDHWVAGETMVADIEAARCTAPNWPCPPDAPSPFRDGFSPNPPKPSQRARKPEPVVSSTELDDDIPF